MTAMSSPPSRLLFQILLTNYFFTVITFARVSPSISVNTTSGDICFTTSLPNQCSLANLTQYNVSIADITGNLLFKSEDVAESSCILVNFSALLTPQCGPFKISAQAYDDYVTYDSVYHIISPVQLWIDPSYSSPVSDIIIVKYYCLTKYIIPPEIMFANVNNREIGTRICSPYGYIIINAKSSDDYSLHLCGYWTFANQSVFGSCPINCSLLTSYPMLWVTTSLLIISLLANTLLVMVILTCCSYLKGKQWKMQVSMEYPETKKCNTTLYTSSDSPSSYYHCSAPTRHSIKLSDNYDGFCERTHAAVSDESLKYNSMSKVVANDNLHLLYHTTLECDYNGLEHTIIGHNITLRIPKGTIDVGDKVYFEVGILMFGPFTFPGNTQSISPILWLCPSENDYQLKKPFRIILPHFLSSQAVEKMEPGDIQFAKAKHELGQTMNYEFKVIDTNPLFASSGSRDFGILGIQHYCFYCLVANKDVKGAQYCLVQIRRPLQLHRNEVYFLIIYFLDTCLRALEEQYPQKESYNICHYNTFQFKEDESEVCLEMEVTTDHSDCIVGLTPNPPKIWRSDVDFWKNDTNSKTLMYQKHKRKMYPPRIVMVATAKTQDAVFKLQVKFKGCLREHQLNGDLIFPSDVLASQTSIASTYSVGAESRDILSEKPSLKTAYRELLPIADCWKRVGVFLDIPESVLNRIKSDEEESSDRLLKMVSEWVKRINPPPTWAALADAVEPFDKAKYADICRRIPKNRHSNACADLDFLAPTNRKRVKTMSV